jgi:hypothetical protein
MNRVYYAPKAVGSYGGVEPLTRALGDSKPKDVLEWLRSQSTYTVCTNLSGTLLISRKLGTISNICLKITE